MLLRFGHIPFYLLQNHNFQTILKLNEFLVRTDGIDF